MNGPGFLAMCMLVTAFSIACVQQAQALVLTKDGQPAARIILPTETELDQYVARELEALTAQVQKKNPDATEAKLKGLLARARRSLDKEVKRVGDDEKLAAEELSAVLARISGATLAIERHEGEGLPAGPAVLIGSEFARMAGLGKELDALDPDGLLCKVKGNHLILAGRRARGTLYAVYTLLESMGCRWVLPGEFGEILPQMKTVATDINRTENPSHRQRYWWCTYGHTPEYPRWTLRNKGNFVRALGDPAVKQGHALSGPLRWGAKTEKYGTNVMQRVKKKEKGPDGKTLTKWVEQEGPGLPDEFYAMSNGKVNRHVPNMSNPTVWEMYAEYYRDYFAKNPHERYVSVSAEDGFVNDERPDTRKLDSKEFDFFMGAPSATDRFWFFLNRIIEKVAPEYPDRMFGVLVYSNNMAPPRLQQVHRNMALVFAPLGISPLHHVRDPKSKTNRTYKEWFEDWMLLARAAGAETYYYDYEPLGYCWNMAMICPRWAIIGKNYPWFHELGLSGHTTQGYDDFASCGLNNYLMIRLYWNIKQDYRDVVADYARARFGSAAEAMQEYYDILEKRMAEIPDLYSNEVWDNHLILTPEVRAACRAALAKAEKAAGTDQAKAHVQTMLDLQLSTDAMCDAIEHARSTGDYGAAAEKMEVCWGVRDKLNKLYGNFMNGKRTDDKAKALFFSGGIYNQYKSLADKIQNAEARLLLPRTWKGMNDTRNHAAALGLTQPSADVTQLADQDITICPDVTYGTQRDMAAFFYRAQVDVPATFADKKRVVLLFPGLIARAVQIWVNGEPVMFDHETHRSAVWHGADYFWMNYNHEREFDLTGYIRAGSENTIAFRVFKSFDFGGSYRRPWLLATSAAPSKP